LTEILEQQRATMVTKVTLMTQTEQAQQLLQKQL
jgi:hypothetical protein